MQATVVMLIALGGLGCQNPTDAMPPIPPAAAQPGAARPAAPAAAQPTEPATSPPAPSDPAPPAAIQPEAPAAAPAAAPSTGSIPAYDAAPSGYPAYSSAVCGCSVRDPSDNDSPGRCLRDTFCSFFIGRDPDVPSARQIEAAYCAGSYGR